MKKLLIKLVFVGMFIFGFAFVSNALICSTIYVECENGNSGAGLACGEDYVEMFWNGWNYQMLFVILTNYLISARNYT